VRANKTFQWIKDSAKRKALAFLAQAAIVFNALHARQRLGIALTGRLNLARAAQPKPEPKLLPESTEAFGPNVVKFDRC
jgi:hypothetical protein